MNDLLKSRRNLILALACSSLLCGCSKVSSWAGDWPPPENGSSQSGVTGNAPAPGSQVYASASMMDMATPNGLGARDRAAAPGLVMPPQAPGAPEPIMPASMTPQTADQRIAALEKNVGDLRRDINSMIPLLQRLMQSNQDIESVLSQIEKNSGAGMQVAQASPPSLAAPSPPPAIEPMAGDPNRRIGMPVPAFVKAPVPDAKIPPPQEPPRTTFMEAEKPAPVAAARPMMQPAVASTGTVVQAVRFGAQNGKTRIVLDLSGPSAFKYDLDNTENILVIEVPGSDWASSQSGPVTGSQIAQSYSIQNMSGQGNALVIQLTGPASVAYADKLAPSGGKGDRIVIDIAPL